MIALAPRAKAFFLEKNGIDVIYSGSGILILVMLEISTHNQVYFFDQLPSYP